MDMAMSMTSGYADVLGISVVNATPDEVSATWNATPELIGPAGARRGGAHSGVVETLASIGAALWYGQRGHVVGASNSTDLMKPDSEGPHIAIARPIDRNDREQIWTVEISNSAGELAARGQVRLANLPERQPATTQKR